MSLWEKKETDIVQVEFLADNGLVYLHHEAKSVAGRVWLVTNYGAETFECTCLEATHIEKLAKEEGLTVERLMQH